MLNRLFSPEDANRALDGLRPMVEQIVDTKKQLGALMTRVAPLHQQARRDPQARRQLEEAVQSMERLAATLKELMLTVEKRGAVVKDLDLGLVDFPSVIEGQPVYLCWKLGEARVEFYHGIGEGFQGRRKLA